MNISNFDLPPKLYESKHQLSHIPRTKKHPTFVPPALVGIDSAHARRVGSSRVQARQSYAMAVQVLAQAVG